MARATTQGTRRRRSGPVRIDALARECLSPVVTRYGFGSSEMVAAWPEIVGSDLAGRTRPERIRWPRRRDAGEAATLVVRAEGGDALELRHMAELVVERINVYFGWQAVGRLTIRQAPVASPPEPAPDPPPAAPTRDRRLERIEDPELRGALAELGGRIGAAADKTP